MNVCDKPWIDIVVGTLNPYQIHIERIVRNRQVWADVMLPKLCSFFDNALLPELACPREGKSPGIREPGVWYTATIRPPRRRLVKSNRQKGCSTTTSRKKRTRAKATNQQHTTVSDTQTASSVQATAGTSSIRSKRQLSGVKFVGRSIKHQWIIDEASDQREWYTGTVLGVVSGRDGQPNAVYEVSYEGDEETYEVDHLLQDYMSSSLTFTDL